MSDWKKNVLHDVKWARIAAAAALFVGFCNTNAVAALRPLSVQAVVDRVRVGIPFISPNGRFVVYNAVQGDDGSGHNSLEVTNVSSGQTFEVLSSGSSMAPVWSPDGSQLAFYSYANDSMTLWVWDVATHRSRRISSALVRIDSLAALQIDSLGYSPRNPIWSPDGKSIVSQFVPSDMTALQLRKLDPAYLQKNAKKAPVGDSAENIITSTFIPSTQPNPQATPVTGAFDVADIRLLADLGVVDVRTGRLRRLARHVRPSWYAFSPDGRTLAYTHVTTWMRGGLPHFELRTIALTTHTQRTLLANLYGNYVLGSWSSDSTRLAYAIVGSSGGENDPNALYIINRRGGAVRTLFFGTAAEHKFTRPLWDPTDQWIYSQDGDAKILKIAADGSGITEIATPAGNHLTHIVENLDGTYWSTDSGKSMILTLQNVARGTITFCRFDLASRTCTATFSDAMQGRTTMGWPSRGSSIFPYFASSVSDPGNIWVSDATLLHPHRVSNANPDILKASLGKTQIISWNSLTGEQLQGALMLPSNYEPGKRYPLVVYFYPDDPGSRHVSDFGFTSFAMSNMQILASRGYAVFYPNVPIHEKLHTPMQDMYDAIMPGVDAVIALGVADPQKLAVMGHSFGGYGTLGLVTQTHRFAAAIATSAAPSELVEGYERFLDPSIGFFDYYTSGQGDMGCTPWECRDRYIANSPFFGFDKVTTPLFIECGGADGLQLCGSDSEVFNSLRRLNKNVEFVEYVNGGHGLEQSSDLLDFWQRVLEFLNRTGVKP